jgi:hypothetical protein
MEGIFHFLGHGQQLEKIWLRSVEVVSHIQDDDDENKERCLPEILPEQNFPYPLLPFRLSP